MYKTIESESADEFVEKKSRFIGHIRPVKTVNEASEFIEKISKKHYNATHNVFAYILRDGQISRYSDNGEPQGTAGIPVLDVLQKEGLSDICVVATRYFGGTMLGGGGLVRAYSHTASIAVASARVITMVECTRLVLEIDYSLYGKLSYIFPQYNLLVESSDFSDTVALKLMLEKDMLDKFIKQVTEITNANHTISILHDIYYAKEMF